MDLVILLSVCVLMVGLVSGNVVLIARNVPLSTPDAKASFAPNVKGCGECGVLHVAEPLDACTQLMNNITRDATSIFVLITRGGCMFDDKVKRVQDAGFRAAIVYDNENNGALISMAGSSVGNYIHAVFVPKASGETLNRYAGHEDVELCVIPTFEMTLWPIMAISFLSFLAISSVISTVLFICSQRILHLREQSSHEQLSAPNGISGHLVRAIPSLIFETALEDSCTSTTCAICLDDYSIGDELRILPCRHKFHALCVDFGSPPGELFVLCASKMSGQP